MFCRGFGVTSQGLGTASRVVARRRRNSLSAFLWSFLCACGTKERTERTFGCIFDKFLIPANGALLNPHRFASLHCTYFVCSQAVPLLRWRKLPDARCAPLQINCSLAVKYTISPARSPWIRSVALQNVIFTIKLCNIPKSPMMFFTFDS